jgi:ABC-type amino acid transport substrate-binding protein
MALLFGFNPSFNADLFEYHFGGTAAQSVGYTRAEQAYLASRPVVDVYYETDWAPFEYESGGEAVGITPEIIRAIGRDTGITFRFVLTSSTQDVYAKRGRQPQRHGHGGELRLYAWADEPRPCW